MLWFIWEGADRSLQGGLCSGLDKEKCCESPCPKPQSRPCWYMNPQPHPWDIEHQQGYFGILVVCGGTVVGIREEEQRKNLGTKPVQSLLWWQQKGKCSLPRRSRELRGRSPGVLGPAGEEHGTRRALALGCAELWFPGWPLVPACPVPGRQHLPGTPQKQHSRAAPLL